MALDGAPSLGWLVRAPLSHPLRRSHPLGSLKTPPPLFIFMKTIHPIATLAAMAGSLTLSVSISPAAAPDRNVLPIQQPARQPVFNRCVTLRDSWPKQADRS